MRGKKRGQKWIEEGGIQRERKKSEKRGEGAERKKWKVGGRRK